MSQTWFNPTANTSSDRAVRALETLSRAPIPRQDAAVRRRWRGAHLRRLLAGDAACAVVAVAAGLGVQRVLSLPLVALVLPMVWLAALAVVGSYDRNIQCEGLDEFRRVLAAAGVVVAGVGLYSWLWEQEVSHGLVALTLAVATASTLAERVLQRRVLCRARAEGRSTQTTLLVGTASAVAALHERLRRRTPLGFRVIGCCLPATEHGASFGPELPVLGGLADVRDVVRRYDIDTVAAIPSAPIDGAALRRLDWELETTRVDLVLAPAVTDLPGFPRPRLSIQAHDGLPLLHVTHRRMRRGRRPAKAIFDRVVAAVLLVLVAPVFVAVAVAVKAETRGPLLVREGRVGRGGQPCTLLKFRSTTTGPGQPDFRLIGSGDGDGVRTPVRLGHHRVTRVGHVLRRFSLERLPQLFNVLTGEMSLVGPRPLRSTEIEQHRLDLQRYFVVKPGLTGWWLIGDRSELPWEESVSVDVHYVENWSLTVDLLVLWRTCRAVIRNRARRPAATTPDDERPASASRRGSLRS